MNSDLCARCPFSQRGCEGPCVCTADESRRDLIAIAAAGDCPKGFFAEPEKMPPRLMMPIQNPIAPPDIPLAGDVVEGIAKAIGADRLAKLWTKWTGLPCGCAERKAALNAASERLLKWWGKRVG